MAEVFVDPNVFLRFLTNDDPVKARAYAIGKLGPQNAREAFARIDRPEIEVFVVPGGNFPTMSSVAAWEREFKKPVVTTNQASIWAMLRTFNSVDRLPAFGRLLAEVPADAS